MQRAMDKEQGSVVYGFFAANEGADADGDNDVKLSPSSDFWPFIKLDTLLAMSQELHEAPVAKRARKASVDGGVSGYNGEFHEAPVAEKRARKVV